MAFCWGNQSDTNSWLVHKNASSLQHSMNPLRLTHLTAFLSALWRVLVFFSLLFWFLRPTSLMFWLICTSLINLISNHSRNLWVAVERDIWPLQGSCQRTEPSVEFKVFTCLWFVGDIHPSHSYRMENCLQTHKMLRFYIWVWIHQRVELLEPEADLRQTCTMAAQDDS